jgi:hypothetical protein
MRVSIRLGMRVRIRLRIKLRITLRIKLRRREAFRVTKGNLPHDLHNVRDTVLVGLD